MQLAVVTPERTVVEVEATELYAPGTAGQLGVLTDHVTFLGTLDAGELQFKGPGGSGSILMAGGVVEVVDNKVTVLADVALAPEEIDYEAARRDLEDAESRMSAAPPMSAEHAAADAARKWAVVRIEAKR